jgi:four helix bundle protein
LKIECFIEIESWKEARVLVNEIYKAIISGKFSKDNGLRDQIQRAAVSIMSNITDRFVSGSRKSFSSFQIIHTGKHLK